MLRILVACLCLILLTADSSFAGSRMLFDGTTFSGWTTLKGDPVTQGWEANEGILHLPAGTKGGHIITDRDYTNFVLDFEFKISPGGNSGIKYRVKKFDGKTLGCEYQILDDSADKFIKLSENKRTASLYDVYAPASRRVLFGPNEYNEGRIVVCGNRIEHWLNGRRVVCATVGSEKWQAGIAGSKFKAVKGFGENAAGRIMITDHNNEVSYRNIFICELGRQRQRCPLPYTRLAR